MAGFEDQLNSILDNQEAMSQIMNLAQSLGGGQTEQAQQTAPPPPPPQPQPQQAPPAARPTRGKAASIQRMFRWSQGTWGTGRAENMENAAAAAPMTVFTV